MAELAQLAPYSEARHGHRLASQRIRSLLDVEVAPETGTTGGGHDACVRGCRVAKSTAVQAALAEAEKGDFSGLIICGVEAEILALKRISNDPSVAAYVRLEALRVIMEHRRANPEPEPEPPKKQSTIEELERMLRTQCRQKPGVTNRANGFDADLHDPDFNLD